MEVRLRLELAGLEPGGEDDRVSPRGDDELRKAPAVKLLGGVRQEVSAEIDRNSAGVVEFDPVGALSPRIQ